MRALEAAATIGPYFAWDELPGPTGDWRPLAELDEPEVLAGRVAVVRRALASGTGPDAVPERVAASVWSLGVFSRLVSAPLAAVAFGADLPAPRRDQVWWRAVDGGPLPVAVAGIGVVATVDADDDAVAEAFGEIVVDGLIGPLLAAFRRRFRLSPKVLRGNVASALGGAVTVLANAGISANAGAGIGANAGAGTSAGISAGAGARDGSGVDRARRIVERLLARPPLAGEATVVRPPWRLRRANCCLYYRVPGGGYCGDCVLHPVNR
ncbi:(2Fe-2S)-binding protein [Virgisporangium aurantiacum]|uniref:Ferric siderophore reductase C-terminal domain-containing protein n=1 Tax=Virgisporangium aurantiacum TaxID=175570 RepID=A0A8J4E2V9_9ACTN|nr:(2Fe-2S)-binding protein [Virgisporangium aurantiacum]GIJ60250.1 hypothetical protein Vau01_077660 [Virgisporangium aurantiacum]